MYEFKNKDFYYLKKKFKFKAVLIWKFKKKIFYAKVFIVCAVN